MAGLAHMNLPLYSDLVSMLRNRAQADPDELAFTYLLDGESQAISITLQELDRQARAIGASLQELNSFGERILLLYPPSLEYISAFFGCLYAGAIAVPAYPPDVTRLDRTLPRFLSIIKDSQPVAILTITPILTLAQMILHQTPELRSIRWLATDALPANEIQSPSWKEPAIDKSTLAFLQYTSGSTAEPKGVMLTHGNLMANLEVIRNAFEISSDSVGFFWLPFYHDMGLIGGILEPVYSKVHVTWISPLDFLQRPLRWLKAISQGKATISGGPNFAYDLCVRKATPEFIEILDLSNWVLAFNGAEPIRASTIENFSRTFEPCGFRREAFYPCYGLAEATLLVTGVKVSEPPMVRYFMGVELSLGKIEPVQSDAPADQLNKADDMAVFVGCGGAGLGHEVVIVDPNTLEACQGGQRGSSTIGEIWVNGPSVASGYWNRPEISKQTFYAKITGEVDKKYLRTGDLGFLWDGQLFVTGRIKDLIIVDGLNHYPQDIELTVEKSLPAIRPGCSAAFFVEIQEHESLVVVAEVAPPHKLAALQEETPGKLSSEAIKNTIRLAVSQAHDLRIHEIVLLKPGSIPKTSSGKIQRQACKTAFLAGALDIWAG